MGHGLGTDARLVGKSAAADAGNDHRSQGTASNRLAGEGIGNDQHQVLGHHLIILQQDPDRRPHIQQHHGRHQFGGDRADANDAPKDHQGYQGGDQDAAGKVEAENLRGFQPPVGDKHHFAKDLYQLIDLEKRQAADQASKAEERCQGFPAPPKAFRDHIHRSALEMPHAVFTAVHDRQRAGEEFGGDADQRTHPHPENRSRPSGLNGDGHSGNIAHPDGPGQGAGEGLEVGNVAGIVRVVIFTLHNGDGMFKIAEG